MSNTTYPTRHMENNPLYRQIFTWLRLKPCPDVMTEKKMQNVNTPATSKAPWSRDLFREPRGVGTQHLSDTSVSLNRAAIKSSLITRDIKKGKRKEKSSHPHNCIA